MGARASCPRNSRGLEARAPTLATGAILRHKLLGLAEQYARTPTHELKAEMDAVLEALKPLDPRKMKEEIKGLVGKSPFETATVDDWNAVITEISNPKGIPPLVAHLVSIGESLGGPLPPEKFLTASSARALFDGDLPFTTLVEARWPRTAPSSGNSRWTSTSRSAPPASSSSSAWALPTPISTAPRSRPRS